MPGEKQVPLVRDGSSPEKAVIIQDDAGTMLPGCGSGSLRTIRLAASVLTSKP